jgi:hypothetical protein
MPCYFKERINDFANKLLVAETGSHCLYDVYPEKEESRTLIYGPYWSSLLRHHNVILGDVITFTCFEDDEEDNGFPEKHYNICYII